jgi:hypothetical protein
MILGTATGGWVEAGTVGSVTGSVLEVVVGEWSDPRRTGDPLHDASAQPAATATTPMVTGNVRLFTGPSWPGHGYREGPVAQCSSGALTMQKQKPRDLPTDRGRRQA